jgi:predicted ATPase
MSDRDHPRFTRLAASNFLSLGKHVSVELGDLTALAGINGSGKSNVVGALTFAANALANGLEHAVVSRRGFQALRRNGAGGGHVTLRYEIESGSWSGDYEMDIGPAGDAYVVAHETASVSYTSPPRRVSYEAKKGELQDPLPALAGLPPTPTDLVLRLAGGTPDFAPLRNALQAVRSYAIYPRALREPSKPSVLPYLDEEGHNWASIVRHVASGRYGGELRAALAQVTGDVVDLKTQQLGDNLAVLFRHQIDDRRPGKNPWFDAGRESDGTLRVAGLLTALLQEPPLTLIAIEEPELTIHPGALPLILDFLRMASSWSQVLITTHSPDLIDRLDPDEIRVVQRQTGTTTVSLVDPGQRELVRQQLASPGELMRTEGLAPSTSDL